VKGIKSTERSKKKASKGKSSEGDVIVIEILSRK